MPETLWEFETQRLLVKLEAEPSEFPDTSWMDDEQLAELESGKLAMFDAICTVYGPRGEVLGQDVLGQCSYYEPSEFVTAHRDPNPLHRNSTIYRNAKGENCVICHYFPSMVKEACREARETVAKTTKAYEELNLRP